MSQSKFSICIPWVFSNTSDQKIRKVFENLQCGVVESVHQLKKDDHNIAFVNFSEWFGDEKSLSMRESLENGEVLQVVYDEPWFWKISKCRERPQKSSYHAKPYVKFVEKPAAEPEPEEETEEEAKARAEGWQTIKKKKRKNK